MSMILDALRAGQAPGFCSLAGGPRVLVAGGGGGLGSALLEHLLVSGRCAQVRVLVTQPLKAGLRGLQTVAWGGEAGVPVPADDTAVVVFDRVRGANGREQAFFRPQPEQLPEMARWLAARGVRHLLVVMPHDQATLPEALKRGLASLDEQAVAAMGFDHLVFVRSAQVPDAVRHRHPAQRLAHWMLSQLQIMVPQRDRPPRAVKVAQFAAALAAQLSASPPGTRVVPPEVVWDAAQSTQAAAFASAWLSGLPPPAPPTPSSRR